MTTETTRLAERALAAHEHVAAQQNAAAEAEARQRVVVEYDRRTLRCWAQFRHGVLVDELRVRRGKPSRLATVQEALRAAGEQGAVA